MAFALLTVRLTVVLCAISVVEGVVRLLWECCCTVALAEVLACLCHCFFNLAKCNSVTLRNKKSHTVLAVCAVVVLIGFKNVYE